MCSLSLRDGVSGADSFAAEDEGGGGREGQGLRRLQTSRCKTIQGTTER